jgi:hypothetical protein
VRAIVHKEFQELVDELGIEGGPRVQRVDDLFDVLEQQIDLLEDKFGFDDPKQINTVEEEQNLTNFLVVRDYVRGLDQAWQTFRAQFIGTGSKFLGTQFVLLSRALSVVAESVSEVELTMESVFLGPRERQTVRIEFPAQITLNGQLQPIFKVGTPPSMLVSELLDWITRFASDEGPALINDGGRIGISSVQTTADRLQRLVLGAAQTQTVTHIGFTRTRVRRALEELASQIGQVARLAQEVIL